MNLNSSELNKIALDHLSQGHFSQAQMLLFKNARMWPSHETYNNLGHFLCSEGLECKNGRVRNADKLGLQYLLKAEQIRYTSINQSNIAYELEKQRYADFGRTGIDNYNLCYAAYQHMERAVELGYSNELEYNRLRFLFLCDRTNVEILAGIKGLSLKLETVDIIEFLLNLFCIHSDYQQCLKLISKYKNELDEMCLLYMYCLCGIYEEGAILCDTVYKKFALNETTIAMMVNCLLNSGESSKAKILKNKLKKDIAENEYMHSVALSIDQIFDSSEYRKRVIQSYRFYPAFLPTCGYFGCKHHGTPFLNI